MAGRHVASTRLVCSLLVLVAIAALLCAAAPAFAAEPTATRNIFYHNYTRWAKPSVSYLCTAADGSLQRVEYANNELFYEAVDSGYQTVSERCVVSKSTYAPSNLVSDGNFVWGGFFAGVDANYVAAGQENLNEDDGLAVLRVTKYSKSWDYLGAYEAKGANTYIPFDAGGCSIAESGGVLYVRTCHEMYASSDGLHHQANMTFVIDEATMTSLAEEHKIAWQGSAFGYVSHSFNQYLTVLDGQAYGFDHGDAGPRSITAKKLGVLYGGYADVLPFGDSGGAHYNYTGGTLGGLASSSSTGMLLSVGSLADQSVYYTNVGVTAYNAWVAATPAGALDGSGGQTSITCLTSYPASGTKSAGNPFIVKVNDNRFCVIWDEQEKREGWSGFWSTGKVCYVFVDGSGSPISSVQTQVGVLSDCQPVLHDGKIVWYASGIVDDFFFYDPTVPAYFEIGASDGSYQAFIPLDAVQASMSLSQKYINGEWVYRTSFTGKEQTPDVTMTYFTTPLANGEDYTVSYEANRNAGTATATVSGQGAFTSTKKLAFVIDPVHVYNTTIDSIDAHTYTGSALSPKPKVSLDGVTLIEGSDYTLEYYSNVNAGTARVNVVGTGNLTSSRSVYFTIEPLDISAADLGGLLAKTYTGSAIMQAPTVKLNGKTLVEGTDYTLSCSNNVNAGTATMVVTGRGNYTGSATSTFEIERARVADPVAKTGLVYTGNAQVGVAASEGYDVTGGSAANAGSYTAVARLDSNHAWDNGGTSDLEVPWAIEPADLTNADALPIADQTYTGKALTPRLAVSLDGVALSEGTDYLLSYKDNVEPGTATVTATGKGNYTGSKSATFQIVRPADPQPASRWLRLRGSSALDTMGAIVDEGFERADTVVIATSAGFADALAASALAGAHNAPILMTELNSLSPQTKTQIERLGATRAYVCGGRFAVSDAVISQLTAQTACKDITRVKGSAADDTSREIARELGGAASDTVIIATQLDYRDALSASSYAYATKSPIVLLDRKAKLSDTNVDYLKGAGFKRAVIVGGRFAVPEAVESQLRSAGIPAGNIERLRGTTAYDTSVAIAEWAISRGFSADGMGVACGQNYPDALAGAALCGKNRSVLLLADGKNSKVAVDFARANKASINGGYVFGGRFAVPDAVMSAFESATGASAVVVRS